MTEPIQYNEDMWQKLKKAVREWLDDYWRHDWVVVGFELERSAYYDMESDKVMPPKCPGPRVRIVIDLEDPNWKKPE